MKTAIYNTQGKKIAGDTSLVENLSQHILQNLPIIEDGCLFSRESDGTVSALCADEPVLRAFFEKREMPKQLSRNEVICELLYGTHNTGDIRRLCKRQMLEFDEQRCVIIIEGVSEILDSNTETELSQLFEDNDADVVRLSDGKITFVCTVHDEDEAGELCKAFKQTFNSDLQIDVHVGMGNIASDAAGLSTAFVQANEALRAGKRISFYGGVWEYSKVLPELLLMDSATGISNAFAKEAQAIAHALDDDTRTIVDEMFKQNLNISETARRCYLHRNTLIYRLDKLAKDTGLNMRNFDDAVALRLFIAVERLK